MSDLAFFPLFFNLFVTVGSSLLQSTFVRWFLSPSVKLFLQLNMLSVILVMFTVYVKNLQFMFS